MMKKFRKLTAALSILMCAIMLCACSFVNYVEVAPNDRADAELANLKTEYITLINDGYDGQDYRENERRILSIAIQDAVNEINECDSEESVTAVYSKHVEELNAIPTDLALTKSEAVAEISGKHDPEDYRDAEKADLDRLVKEYGAKIDACEDIGSVRDLVREFITESYFLKTDAQYLTEELNAFRAETSEQLGNYKNLSLYRAEQTAEIKALVAEYGTAVAECKNIRDAQSLFESYKAKLDGVKTDAQLYAEEKREIELAHLGDLRTLAGIVDGYMGDGFDADKYVKALETEMRACETKREVNSVAAREKKRLGEIGARNGNKACLPYLQDAVCESMKVGYSESTYRAGELEIIKNKIAELETEVKAVSDVDTILSYEGVFAEYLKSVPTNAELWEREDEQFSADLRSLYGGNVLTVGRLNAAGDYYELAEIIDFYAFYQTDYNSFVRDTFRVKLEYEHKDAQYEINEVYWYCELIRSAVGITGWIEDSDFLVIKLIPYALATDTNKKDGTKSDSPVSTVEYDSDSSAFTARGETFDDFAYKKYTKKLDGVWNTQQLWYALEHEYYPICTAGSPAEKTLDRAKQILRSIISEGMSDEEKLFRIYKWAGENIKYDGGYTRWLYPEDRDHFPDALAATSKAFHVEGALFDGLAVCEGYAKSHLLLLRMEGIVSFRYFVRSDAFRGLNSINPNVGGYGSHAFVALPDKDGKYYFSDTEQSLSNGVISYNQMMIPRSLFTGYNGFTYMYPDMQFASAPSGIYDRLIQNGKRISVRNKAELKELLDAVTAEQTTVNIIADSSVYPDFKRDLFGMLEGMQYAGLEQKAPHDPERYFYETIVCMKPDA